MSTAYLYDPIFLEHQQAGHVESPDRLEQINLALDRTGMRDRLISIAPQPISIERLDFIAGFSGLRSCNGSAMARFFFPPGATTITLH